MMYECGESESAKVACLPPCRVCPGSFRRFAMLAAVTCLGTLALTACGSGGGGGNNPAPPELVSVAATPSKPTYTLGEEVRLDVTLENVSTSPVAVATVDEALKIVSITRDGADVTGEVFGLKSEFDLKHRVDQSLTTLAPGGQTTILKTSVHMGAPKGQSLGSSGVGTLDYERTLFSLGATGDYVVNVSYRFQGDNPHGLPVTTGETKTGSASFTIVP